MPELTIVRDAAELAARAADHFIDRVAAAIAQRGRADVALAGGSTPKAMNALLAAPARRAALDWAKVRFFFGDERCVPPDHADSNYRMTRETLFEPLGIAPERVFRIRGEDEPHAAAATYDAVLARELGAAAAFDVLNLGMGPDGHTASLFPGTLATIDEQRLCVAVFVEKFATYRITLTPRAINAARDVTITAGGDEKAGALQAVLAGLGSADDHPVSLVAPRSGALQWFVDAAAASRLPD